MNETQILIVNWLRQMPIPASEWKSFGSLITHKVDIESITFLRAISTTQSEGHFLSFHDASGETRFYLLWLRNTGQGWEVVSCSMSQSWPEYTPFFKDCPHPHAVIGGHGDPSGGVIGGFLYDPTNKVSKVELVFEDGRVINDIVENKIILFLIEHAFEIPMKKNYYNSDDHLVFTAGFYDIV